MTLIQAFDVNVASEHVENATPDAHVLKIPQGAPTESFPLFTRIAGALFFGVLALMDLRILVGMTPLLLSGAGGLSVALHFASVFCVAIFYGLTCWLLMARPPPVASQGRAAPVVTAFVGSYLVWLLPFIPQAPAWPALVEASSAISLVGDALIVYTLCRLGRSFSIAPQARRLVTDGPYRIIRHPLYATEEIALIGILMQHVWWGALAFFVVHIALQIRRMLYEEALLGAVFPDYAAYARRTARLIPGVW